MTSVPSTVLSQKAAGPSTPDWIAAGSRPVAEQTLRHDPTPELSIYLPDAVVGAPSGDKFNIKGRDRNPGLISTATSIARRDSAYAAPGIASSTRIDIMT